MYNCLACKHVNIIMLKVDIDKLHVDIILLHVDIIYLACRRQRYVTIVVNTKIKRKKDLSLRFVIESG